MEALLNVLGKNYNIYIKMILSLVSLLQNYSPQFESYDVKAGVAGGGIGGYPGPAVRTRVPQHRRAACWLTSRWLTPSGRLPSNTALFHACPKRLTLH